MANSNESSPKLKHNSVSLPRTVSSTVVDVFSIWRVVPTLMILGVAAGIWLGLASHPGEKQIEEVDPLDKARVQGLRAALPINQNGADAAMFNTALVPAVHPCVGATVVGTPPAPPAVKLQEFTAPAYLIAAADPYGVRLKTIVTR